MGLAVAASILTTGLTGCGDEDSPAAPPKPAPVVTDEITVSLKDIQVVQNCTNGFLQYQFYVVATVDGTETTYLTTNWSTIQSDDGDVWTNLTSTTFELPRRAGAEFRVRAAVKEWIGPTEAWSRGRNMYHEPLRSSSELWQPDAGGYASYNASQKIGSVSWDVISQAACRIELNYDVEVTPK
jgi:hypothetical protein